MRYFSDSDRHLWRLALPMILSNVSVPLLGLVDTAVTGHLGNASYLGGVAVGSGIISFLFMLFLFLRMSTTGLTAQAYGARDKAALARALIQPLFIAIMVGLIFILVKSPLNHLALLLIGGDTAVLHQATLFLNIRWLSAPATLANLVLLGWLLGVQYARAPVVLLVVGNLINIVLDLWLVIGLKWGVRRAAIATVIAEYSSLAIGLYIVCRVMRLRGITFAIMQTAWRGNLARLLRLNRDIMLRSLMLQLCFFSLTLFGARMGSDVVAVNAVLMTFMTFTTYALDGFAYAVEACSGEAYGAGDSRNLLSIWQAACRQAGLVALFFSLVYAGVGRDIVALLTSLPALQQKADAFLFWQSVLPVCGVWCYLLDGMFIGATRAREMRNSMVIAACCYGLTLITVPVLGNHGLWRAVTVFLLARGLTLWLNWRRHWLNGTWFIS